MQSAVLRTAAAGLIASLGFGALAVNTGSPAASATRVAATDTLTSSYVPYVMANGNIPNPSWWDGRCDGAKNGNYPGSKSLGASWDGLTACGPGPNEGGSDHAVEFFPGAWGEFEWECVELSMRWMYLAWGVPPYGADGYDIVDNYAAANPNGPKLTVVQNGTAGVAPQPGDVLELDDGDADGHTEVVTSSSVNAHGDGTVEAITENLNSPTKGWNSLSVSDWVVSSDIGPVVDWLHNPAWSLEEPLISDLDSAGTLSLKVDALHGRFTDVASDVEQAEVIGGGGSEPAPIIVVLTDSGIVEARFDLPGSPWWWLGRGATQIAATSGEGSGAGARQPTIGWLTTGRRFYVVSRGLSKTPVLEASNVASISLASNSPSSDVLMGYVSRSARAYVKVGTGSYSCIATRVKSLTLADDGGNGTGAVEGFMRTNGRAFVRIGLTGRFSEVGPTATGSVRQLAVATVGTSSKPLIAYLTTGGDAYVDYDGSGWLHEFGGAESLAVAGGDSLHAFPIFAVEQSDGTWIAKDGNLSSRYVSEGNVPALGLGALVVS